MVIMVITQRSRIFRQNLADDGCEELVIPKKRKKVQNTGGSWNLFGGLTKRLPFTEKAEVIGKLKLTSLFMDAKGYHCIIGSESCEYFYINIKMNKLVYLTNLAGIMITSIAWDNTATEQHTKSILLSTKDYKLISYAI